MTGCLYMVSNSCSLRSKRFRGVEKRRKIEERDFRCSSRAKNGERTKNGTLAETPIFSSINNFPKTLTALLLKMNVGKHTKRLLYKVRILKNVYHRCLCCISHQVTIGWPKSKTLYNTWACLCRFVVVVIWLRQRYVSCCVWFKTKSKK